MGVTELAGTEAKAKAKSRCTGQREDPAGSQSNNSHKWNTVLPLFTLL